MAGIYIHVPFCKSRCIYCDFFSTTCSDEWKARYVDALCREMAFRQSELPKGEPVRTLYIGGGTPSQLPVALLHKLFCAFSRFYTLDCQAEVTIEANPDDVDVFWLRALRQTPVNRISMGTQSLDDSVLRLLGRRHTARQVENAVSACREFGYENLSIDLIYGLPGQDMRHWKSDVDTVLSWHVPHLSAYALTAEDGTPYATMLEKGLLQEVDEELSLEMYRYLLQAAEQSGMLHYEISNFCLPGFHSRHNSSYWQGLPYLGFGPGAHSYDGHNFRRRNLPDLSSYVRVVDDVPHEVEVLTRTDCYNELVLTRLRTKEGLPLSLLDSNQRSYILQQARPHVSAGRLVAADDKLLLSRDGIFVSNDIISDLMYV